MSRAYLRLDPRLPDHKEGYPDGAGFAFVLTLCYAEHQPDRGYFKNVALLRAHLGRRARWIPYLIEHHDLVLLPDGRLYFDGWTEWQEGDWKVAERVSRIRDRRRPGNGAVEPKVTPTVTGDVTVATVDTLSDGRRIAVSGKRLAVSGGGDSRPGADGGDEGDALTDYFEVTLRYPTKDTLRDWVLKLGSTYGRDPFRAALATEFAADSNPATLLSRTEAVLAKAKDQDRRRAERAEAERQQGHLRIIGEAGA